MSQQKIVIIGGVATGPKAAARARRLDADAEITIIERGKLLSYGGCGMPYYIEGKVKEISELMATPAGVTRDIVFFDKVKNVKVLNETLALSINREAKTVEVVRVDSDEKQTIPYDKLVLATGGLPLIPPIEGIKTGHVFRLNHPDDAVAAREAITSGGVKRATIIGGGLIGMEVTEALAANGIAVSIVEMFPRLLPTILDFEMSHFLAKHVQAKGVQLYMEEKVIRLEENQGKVCKVVTNKREIDTDMVLLAVGVRPNTNLAKVAGLAIGSTGGIIVNEYLQTSDPDIYAGGDCVENLNLVSGQKVFVPMGSTANKHGRVIGDNVAGRSSTFPGITGTAVCKVFDYNVGRTGLGEEQARQLGYDVVTALVPSSDCAHYYPDNKLLLVKIIADRKTGKLLGGQVVGAGDGVKRIDVLATVLRFGGQVSDVGTLDLGYAPPYASAIDILAHATNTIENKINGLAKAVTPMEVKAKLERNEDFILLDVRGPNEYAAIRIENSHVKLIPLGQLRFRLAELPRDKEIIAFCKISLRGYEAYRILVGAGFENVSFMDGGIVAWPYETVSGNVK